MSKDKDKVNKLEEELKNLEARMQHMVIQYSETRAGSAYGVEYYEIQVKVYQEMINNIKKEIFKLKKSTKNSTDSNEIATNF